MKFSRQFVYCIYIYFLSYFSCIMKLNISYHWFYFDTKLCHDTKNMTYSRIIFITANPHLEKRWFVVRDS